ncbi:hypothetical protein NECAME_00127 [Necator americanus]|uniref:Uncharacterized protein n=1 Tax=Necator americanus TaxID=51031 RepID=W2TZN1_NECAM|nr:hypothetical protein NECAME_00127 [Necator americanus]ETN87268.1 hypothetical protein NECAME_00127 [Necator americanus]
MMQIDNDKVKRMLKPASYVSYYDKLLKSWKIGNSLFHAAALLQKIISSRNRNKTANLDDISVNMRIVVTDLLYKCIVVLIAIVVRT